MARSPNGMHRAALLFEGDIRFGPEYFRLSIDDRIVPHRIFGKPLQWSAGSRFIAAQEWLTMDYAAGPITCAALIDVNEWKIARLPLIRKGFAEDFRFDNGVLKYRKNCPAKATVCEADVVLRAIRNWEDIDTPPLPLPFAGA